MANRYPDVALSAMRDPQRPIALLVGVLLVVVGLAGLSGLLDGDVVDVGSVIGLTFAGREALLLGLFGVPLWLGVTAAVAGLLGVLFSQYAGGGTTFNKVAAGLVLPAVLLLAITDWALAVGSTVALALGLVTLLLAVVLVVVGVMLLNHHLLVVVLPVVAAIAIADWGLSLTELAPAGAAVNLPTIVLLAVLAVGVGLVGFEGGRRLT